MERDAEWRARLALDAHRLYLQSAGIQADRRATLVRRVAVLHDLEGWSLRRIAALLEVSHPTVLAWVLEGRRQLEGAD